MRGAGLVRPAPATASSQRDQPETGIQHVQAAGIGGDHRLAGAARADDDVGVGDVGGPTRRQEPARTGRVHQAEIDDIGGRLADQPANASAGAIGLHQVACPASGPCVAVGYYTDSSQDTEAIIATQNSVTNVAPASGTYVAARRFVLIG